MISETGLIRLDQTVRTSAIMVNLHYRKWIQGFRLIDSS
jgi:hypothetical protein